MWAVSFKLFEKWSCYVIIEHKILFGSVKIPYAMLFPNPVFAVHAYNICMHFH